MIIPAALRFTLLLTMAFSYCSWSHAIEIRVPQDVPGIQKAIAIANDTVYGLTNYLQTQDPEKAKRVARRLRSGMVRVNGIDSQQAAPFGGYKQSGNGREGGVWGLEDYLEIKHVTDWK